MDTLDLVDIQRTRYPNVNKFSHRSKTLGVKSRIDFFLISKQICQKSGHPNLNSTRSQHDNIIIVVALSLLQDKEYTTKILELYPQLREKYHYVNDQQLFWELIKMEIRSTTISFSKGKAPAIRKHEAEIKQPLDELDKIICNSQNFDNIDEILKQYADLKKELQHQYENKGKAAIFRSKCRLVEEGEKATKYIFF